MLASRSATNRWEEHFNKFQTPLWNIRNINRAVTVILNQSVIEPLEDKVLTGQSLVGTDHNCSPAKPYSSCECKKVVSAFWQFLRRKHFILKFLLFLLFLTSYFCHKIVNILICDLRYSLKCVFIIVLVFIIKTNFCQNVSYDLLAFT